MLLRSRNRRGRSRKLGEDCLIGNVHENDIYAACCQAVISPYLLNHWVVCEVSWFPVLTGNVPENGVANRNGLVPHDAGRFRIDIASDSIARIVVSVSLSVVFPISRSNMLAIDRRRQQPAEHTSFPMASRSPEMLLHPRDRSCAAEDLCFERREAVTDVASSGPKRVGKLRRFDRSWLLKEDGGQDQTLCETEIVLRQSCICKRVESARGM